MGKKDVTGRDFFADRIRFAELLNTVLYQGKKVIGVEQLELLNRIYPSLSGKGEAGRDIFMWDKEWNICYGLELETESDYSMPERVMVYDACEMERQIKEINKEDQEAAQEKEPFDYRVKKSRLKETDRLLPVITVVLYLGMDHWEGRQRLSELYHIPAKLQELLGGLVPDYGFLMAEADFVNPDSFQTELKEFFQAMQCRKDKKKLRELLKTESFQKLNDETARAIAVHLDRKRLTRKVEKEGLGMCPALKEWAEDERREGRVEGEKRGLKKGKREERDSIIRNMIREGMDHEMIRRVTGCSQKELSLAIGGLEIICS